MRSGEVVAERFVLERRAGSGRTATVWRARDGATGAVVAVKVLDGLERLDTVRFTREARILAALEHPGIVRYLASGRDASGAAFLAMEWLDGESLRDRLARGRLPVSSALQLGQRIAGAMSVAHEHGVVHRDLKPANVILRAGDVEVATVVDFGIARTIDEAEVTLDGAVLGTPGYLAPEQARGETAVGPAADVFALGCVLFRSLAGRSPFEGADLWTALLRLTVDEPPSLRAANPSVPAAFDALVARTLDKDAERRPRAAELASELEAISRSTSRRVPPPAPSAAPLSSTTRRVQTLLVIASADRSAPLDAPRSAIERLGSRHGGRLAVAVAGLAALAFAHGGSPYELAARAARCALDLASRLPSAALAIVSGVEVTHSLLGSGLVERALSLVAGLANGVPVDEPTAALLRGSFALSDGSPRLLVAGPGAEVHEPRPVAIARSAPLVGRHGELQELLDLVERCHVERRARAGLVIGEAGIGKTRLVRELLTIVEERGEASILTGQADPLRAGSAYSSIVSVLRAAATDEGSLSPRARRCMGPDAADAIEFLGEIAGDASASPSAALVAARQDPALMRQRVQTAFSAWIAAECRTRLVVLVLEDLHWGDLPSLWLLDAALRRCEGWPLLVLVTGRPEMEAAFPEIVQRCSRSGAVIRLGVLGQRAASELAAIALGPRAEREVVARIGERAGGHPLHIEELARAARRRREETDEETFSVTVMAAIQARLDRLGTSAGRTLRAASVMGCVFWEGGVAELTRRPVAEIAADLRSLAEADLVQGERSSRITGQVEHTFRHALVRDAVYEMVPARERRRAHEAAATWLMRAGETDPFLLARHLDGAGQEERAAGLYRVAATHALGAADLATASECATRALAHAMRPEDRAELCIVLARCESERGALLEAERSARRAMGEIDPRHPKWYVAAREAAQACGRRGEVPALEELAASLLESAGDDGTAAVRLDALVVAATQLLTLDRERAAAACLREVELATTAHGPLEPAQHARILRLLGYRALRAGDVATYLDDNEKSACAFDSVGDRVSAVTQRCNVGFACHELGAYERAVTVLRTSLAEAERHGFDHLAAIARHNLGRTLGALGDPTSGIEMEVAAIQAFSHQGHMRLEATARLYAAELLFAVADHAAAAQEARVVLDMAGDVAALRAQALTTLARRELADGVAGVAVILAAEAHGIVEQTGSLEEGESLVRLTHAEALLACGRVPEAARAIAAARARLHQRAAAMNSPELAASFLSRVPENARTLALAGSLAAGH